MSIGDGVFLASLVLSVTALYIATKNRWNWKKIILWPISVVLVVGLVTGGCLYIEHLLDKSGISLAEPTLEESFWGLTLDDSKSDIKFKKGEPTKIYEDDWVYATKQVDGWTAYLIFFKEDKIRFILYEVSNEATFQYNAPSLQGIKLNDSSSDIYSKFGKPSNISISNSELMRTYSYDNNHTFFTLEMDKVKSYGIYNPVFGPMEFSKEKDLTAK